MMKVKKLFSFSLATVILAAILVGCGGVSEEEMAELQALRQEVAALQEESQDLSSEKAKLEREIAELNTKLDQCAKDKEQTKENLEAMGM